MERFLRILEYGGALEEISGFPGGFSDVAVARVRRVST